MEIVYTLKIEVDGKMLWLKENGTKVQFSSKKKLRNFLKNRRFTIKNPEVHLNGEKVSLESLE